MSSLIGDIGNQALGYILLIVIIFGIFIFIWFSIIKRKKTQTVDKQHQISEELFILNKYNYCFGKYLFIGGIPMFKIKRLAIFNIKYTINKKNGRFRISPVGVLTLKPLLSLFGHRFKTVNLSDVFMKPINFVFSENVSDISDTGLFLPVGFPMFTRHRYAYNPEDKPASLFLDWFNELLDKEAVDSVVYAQLLKGSIIDMTNLGIEKGTYFQNTVSPPSNIGVKS